MSPRSGLRKLILAALIIVVSGSLLTVNAGMRGRGKYSGVVIFDRWDTCLLLSGVYITYVSDDVKEGLRPYRNEAIQLDVSAISQPMNPGDALIHKYAILGSAPQSAHGQITEGVSLKAESDFGSDRVTAFLIQIENLGDSPIEIESSEIGPTLLGLSRSTLFTASDGKSAAWITRVSVLNHSSRRSTVGSETLSVDYDVDPGSRFPERFRLNPSESKRQTPKAKSGSLFRGR